MRQGSLIGLVLLALALVPRSADSAMYNGRVIDGPWYSGSIVNHAHGKFVDCRIQFQGDRIRIKLPSGATVIAFMDEEIIADAHEIPCYDPKRSLHWIVDVDDLAR